MLFDYHKRTSYLLKRWAEPHFSFLDRSAHPEEARVRALMNKWYMEYPETARADLRGRFRSKGIGQQTGALNELFLHALFRRLGYRVDVTPVGSDNVSRPDFLLTSDVMPNFDLEATVAEVSSEERSRRLRAARIYDAIDRLDSPDFMLAIKSWSGPDVDPPTRKLRYELKQWLDGLDVNLVPATLRLDDRPSYDFNYGSWEIGFWAIPIEDKCLELDDDRMVGVRLTGIHELDSAGQLRRALEDKTTKYGPRDRPFVIAVSAGADNPFISVRSLRLALFGHNTAVLDHQGRYVGSRREGSGIFWHHGVPMNTRVSGVILVKRLDAWNVSTRMPIYMENPWAEHPLLDVPPVFDRWFGSRDDPASIHRPAELSLSEVFGLIEGWPEVGDGIDRVSAAPVPSTPYLGHFAVGEVWWPMLGVAAHKG